MGIGGKKLADSPLVGRRFRVALVDHAQPLLWSNVESRDRDLGSRAGLRVERVRRWANAPRVTV